jgi:hypothetical protein
MYRLLLRWAMIVLVALAGTGRLAAGGKLEFGSKDHEKLSLSLETDLGRGVLIVDVEAPDGSSLGHKKLRKTTDTPVPLEPGKTYKMTLIRADKKFEPFEIRLSSKSSTVVLEAVPEESGQSDVPEDSRGIAKFTARGFETKSTQLSEKKPDEQPAWEKVFSMSHLAGGTIVIMHPLEHLMK